MQFRNSHESIEKANYIISNNFKRILDASEKLFFTDAQYRHEQEMVSLNSSQSFFIMDNSFKNENEEVVESGLK